MLFKWTFIGILEKFLLKILLKNIEIESLDWYSILIFYILALKIIWTIW